MLRKTEIVDMLGVELAEALGISKDHAYLE
jgi:hypothetical protein